MHILSFLNLYSTSSKDLPRGASNPPVWPVVNSV